MYECVMCVSCVQVWHVVCVCACMCCVFVCMLCVHLTCVVAGRRGSAAAPSCRPRSPGASRSSSRRAPPLPPGAWSASARPRHPPPPAWSGGWGRAGWRGACGRAARHLPAMTAATRSHVGRRPPGGGRARCDSSGRRGGSA